MNRLLSTLQELESITIVDSVTDWKNAIKICFDPLVRKNIIQSQYIDAVISSGESLEFYYLIAEGLAIPHARPEDGVNQTGFSLLIIRQGVQFDSHIFNPIYCLLGLASKDSNSHIETILEISKIFDNENTVNVLSKLNTPSDIIKILSQQS